MPDHNWSLEMSSLRTGRHDEHESHIYAFCKCVWNSFQLLAIAGTQINFTCLLLENQKTRCHLNHPYRTQKIDWVTKDLFLKWFKTELLPEVRCHVSSINLLPQAMLPLDNCPRKPLAEELFLEDGNVLAMFLRLTPRRTYNQWIRSCEDKLHASSNEKPVESLKSITLNNTLFLLYITASLINKS